MNRGFLSVAVAAFFFPTLLCASSLDAFKDVRGTINIAGGTAHIPVMVGAARNIMEANPQVNITVTGGGSGVGVQKVGEGLVDIGNTGRALKQSEIDKYGLVSFSFAIDGVAVVVNDANRVKSLSRGQLSDLFSGKIANWREVGGNDAPVSVYVREDGSGTREVFEEKALNKDTEIASANVVNSNGAMKTAVLQDKNAIGYVGIGHLDSFLQGVAIDGMIPSQENAASGIYTITRQLYMNTKGQPQGVVRSFIDYIYSPQGAAVIEKSGYLPVSKRE